MTPGARLSAAIEALQVFLSDDRQFIDPVLREWARGARYAGSKDRAAVADLVFSALRRLGSSQLGAAEGGEGDLAPRASLLGALRLEGRAVSDIESLCDGEAHRPMPLSAAERRRLTGLPELAAQAPLADFPEWLRPSLLRSVLSPEAECAALARRAALDFRVNTLKTNAEDAAEALGEAELEVEPGPFAPCALRAAGLGAADRPKLNALRPYLDGLVEPQDAASQAVALLAASFFTAGRKDGLALDLCAGAGGKTLALAAFLPAKARLVAFDIDRKRMQPLSERLSRAGATAELLDRRGLRALSGRADLVLADAPCSGSGAWARQPDAKWRLTPQRFARLQEMQRDALALAAEMTAPGGALIYATCSILEEENDAAIARFLEERSDFELSDVDAGWSAAGLRDRPPRRPNSDLDAGTVLLPPSHRGTDGFYAAALRRRRAR